MLKVLGNAVGQLLGDAYTNRRLAVICAEFQLDRVDAMRLMAAVCLDNIAARVPGLFFAIERIRMNFLAASLKKCQQGFRTGNVLFTALRFNSRHGEAILCAAKDS